MFCTCWGLGLGLVFSCVSFFFFYLASTGVLLLFYHCNRNLGHELVFFFYSDESWLARYMLDKAVFFFKVLSAFSPYTYAHADILDRRPWARREQNILTT